VSGRATSVSDHDCVTGAFLHGVPDRSFNVLINSGGV
jgi:hypothetical protein